MLTKTFRKQEFVLFISVIFSKNKINYEQLDSILRDILDTIDKEHTRYSNLVEDCDALQDMSNEDFTDNRSLDDCEEQHQVNIDRKDKLENMIDFINFCLED